MSQINWGALVQNGLNGGASIQNDAWHLAMQERFRQDDLKARKLRAEQLLEQDNADREIARLLNGEPQPLTMDGAPTVTPFAGRDGLDMPPDGGMQVDPAMMGGMGQAVMPGSAPQVAGNAAFQAAARPAQAAPVVVPTSLLLRASPRAQKFYEDQKKYQEGRARAMKYLEWSRQNDRGQAIDPEWWQKNVGEYLTPGSDYGPEDVPMVLQADEKQRQIGMKQKRIDAMTMKHAADGTIIHDEEQAAKLDQLSPKGVEELYAKWVQAGPAPDGVDHVTWVDMTPAQRQEFIDKRNQKAQLGDFAESNGIPRNAAMILGGDYVQSQMVASNKANTDAKVQKAGEEALARLQDAAQGKYKYASNKEKAADQAATRKAGLTNQLATPGEGSGAIRVAADIDRLNKAIDTAPSDAEAKSLIKIRDQLMPIYAQEISKRYGVADAGATKTGGPVTADEVRAMKAAGKSESEIVAEVKKRGRAQ